MIQKFIRKNKPMIKPKKILVRKNGNRDSLLTNGTREQEQKHSLLLDLLDSI